MPRICSSGPIFLIVRSWSRKSSSVKSSRRIFSSSFAASSTDTASSAFSMSDSTSPMPSTRETTRSAWNGSRSCSRSPLPTNAIGTPTTPTTDNAAPPRASPSILVSTTPVTPMRRLNSPALLIASCPVIASATNSRSTGLTAALMASSSTINSSSMCSRPAVSTMTTSNPPFFASASAPAARFTGSISPAGSWTRTPACLPTTDNC